MTLNIFPYKTLSSEKALSCRIHIEIIAKAVSESALDESPVFCHTSFRVCDGGPMKFYGSFVGLAEFRRISVDVSHKPDSSYRPFTMSLESVGKPLTIQFR